MQDCSTFAILAPCRTYTQIDVCGGATCAASLLGLSLDLRSERENYSHGEFSTNAAWPQIASHRRDMFCRRIEHVDCRDDAVDCDTCAGARRDGHSQWYY